MQHNVPLKVISNVWETSITVLEYEILEETEVIIIDYK